MPGGQGLTISHALLESKAAFSTHAVPSLHCLLRDATMTIHERMHGHDGFRAVKEGVIDKASYRKLLCRLYGFYSAFERETDLGNERSRWLCHDLAAVGFNLSSEDEIPECAAIPSLKSAHRRIGALYVAAGSALGGRQLARGLDHLFPSDETAGRHFFLGHGAQTGAMWRDYLAQLAAVPPDPDTQTEIVDAALETFAVFESWASGWKDVANG